eukprot:TRINITY_DN3312_c0_g1_i1.p1 TRINITY_DN3312_c0_g1~~TRINITY_DN3312_c0_g1_i1.p1  ORF type:complete len:226 (-),score=60.18 TRINITY_DN3312_c0_g1_i1:82-759(-)
MQSANGADRSERVLNDGERQGDLKAVGFVMCPTASKLKEYYCAQLNDNAAAAANVSQDVILEVVGFVCAGDGEMVDAKDVMDCWALANVIELDEEGKRCKVHYIGWSVKYDEWISCESARIQPAFSQTLRSLLKPDSLSLRSFYQQTTNLQFQEMEAFGFNKEAVRMVIASFDSPTSISLIAAFNAIISWSKLGPSSVQTQWDVLFRKVLKIEHVGEQSGCCLKH